LRPLAIGLGIRQLKSRATIVFRDRGSGDPRRVRLMRRGLAGAVSALMAMLVASHIALAEDDCQVVFERWAKFSRARLRTPPPGDDRGACLDSDVVRRELLDGLTRIRTTCQSATPGSDSSPQNIKAMIEINDGFIRSLAVCPKAVEAPPASPAWNANLKVDPKAKADAKPKVDPKPKVEPKPKVIATKAVAPPRTCLELEHAKADRYTLVNRHCAGQIVLAVVEMRDAVGKTACKAYSVNGTLTVATGDTATLTVDHECVLNRGSCTSKHVGSMFPECDW
jgi:hypothetical protein